MNAASLQTVRAIMAELGQIDGAGFYVGRDYFASLADADLLRKRMAERLALLEAEVRERRIVVYKLWCAGGNDCCAWCGMRFAKLSDVTAIGGKLYHGFFCSERYTDLSAEKIEVTDAGRVALSDTQEIEEESRFVTTHAEKVAMFRGGMTGCAKCNRPFADLSEAKIEDGALVHTDPCTASNERRTA